VERQSAQLRLTNATNQLEKDKLTLARIIGLATNQDFELSDPLAYPHCRESPGRPLRRKLCVLGQIFEAPKQVYKLRRLPFVLRTLSACL
jgi:hypothetical protein